MAVQERDHYGKGLTSGNFRAARLGRIPYDIEGCEIVVCHHINSSVLGSIDFLFKLLNEYIKVVSQEWLLF